MQQAPHPATNTPQADLRHQLSQLAAQSRRAYQQLATSTLDARNKALRSAAQNLREQATLLLDANQKDLSLARQQGMSGAMLDRLSLNPSRIEAMAKGLETVANLPDPLARKLAEWDAPSGLHIIRQPVPLGVIGIIYESRPNVTADAAGLCIKSGNAAILRGGSDSYYSSQAILRIMQRGLQQAGLPIEAVQSLPTQDREAVGHMLQMVGEIDVIIPRGGLSLTQRIQQESRVPTLLHLEGNCHLYIHAQANPAMALAIVENAKMRRTGICGATESLVMDRSLAPTLLPAITEQLTARHCEVRGEAEAIALDHRIQPATEADWSTEYLDAILSVKLVDGLEEAIEHINHYSSHHTDAIVTDDKTAAKRFLQQIDSAIVMHNASTQFADGGEFGMGAEIGIATGRLHARGPVGAAELTTYKYVVLGNGHTRPA